MERRRKHVGIDPSTLKNVFVETNDDRINIEQEIEAVDSTETVYDISIKEEAKEELDEQSATDFAVVEEDELKNIYADATEVSTTTPFFEEADKEASKNIQEETTEATPEETVEPVQETVEESVMTCEECVLLKDKSKQFADIKELLESYENVLIAEEQTLKDKIDNLPDTTESLLSKIQLSAKRTLIQELLRDFKGKFLSILDN